MKALTRLLAGLAPGIVAAALAPWGAANADPAEDVVWTDGLRAAYFGDRPIVESDEVIELVAPVRAENGAIVPVSINSKLPQTASRYIESITLLIDKNPVPLAGRFRFTANSGRADLAMRIRVNEYTPVRAVAQLNDGTLHMSRRYVKASGGCSAPVGTDIESAMKRLGKMRLRIDDGTPPGSPLLTSLGISHPNVTGMQMDQLTRLFAPAHFIKTVEVTFRGEPVFSAETDISISENPNYRFYFVPAGEGELRAEVEDSRGMRFSHAWHVSPGEFQAKSQ